MLEAGKSYNYHLDNSPDIPTEPVLIERVVDGIAYATSGVVANLGPFTMTFNANTGEGTDLYFGSHLDLEAVDV